MAILDLCRGVCKCDWGNPDLVLFCLQQCVFVAQWTEVEKLNNCLFFLSLTWWFQYNTFGKSNHVFNCWRHIILKVDGIFETQQNIGLEWRDPRLKVLNFVLTLKTTNSHTDKNHHVLMRIFSKIVLSFSTSVHWATKTHCWRRKRTKSGFPRSHLQTLRHRSRIAIR